MKEITSQSQFFCLDFKKGRYFEKLRKHSTFHDGDLFFSKISLMLSGSLKKRLLTLVYSIISSNLSITPNFSALSFKCSMLLMVKPIKRFIIMTAIHRTNRKNITWNLKNLLLKFVRFRDNNFHPIIYRTSANKGHS